VLIEIPAAPKHATGLMNFDPAHDVHVELHPVWALAMNVNPQGSTDDDTWVFFVRNSGNEGFCGGSQEFIDFPNNQYTFRLPWNLPWGPGATSATVIKLRKPVLDLSDVVRRVCIFSTGEHR